MSYVVETGGKQYLVKPGDVLKVEKLNKNEGEEVLLPQVADLSGNDNLFVTDKFVPAKILAHVKGKKDIVFKKKRRQNYRRKMGHRQNLTQIQILAPAA